MTSDAGAPSTYSIAMNGRPSILPASNTFTTWSESTWAAVCASRRNRSIAIASWPFLPSITFTTTVRPRSTCLAR
jgi:hypothetical protein